jgi:hypothetical protein
MYDDNDKSFSNNIKGFTSKEIRRLWGKGRNKSYQVVNWFPKWAGFGFKRIDRKTTDLGLIYDWILFAFWWEIRKWHDG